MYEHDTSAEAAHHHINTFNQQGLNAFGYDAATVKAQREAHAAKQAQLKAEFVQTSSLYLFGENGEMVGQMEEKSFLRQFADKHFARFVLPPCSRDQKDMYRELKDSGLTPA